MSATIDKIALDTKRPGVQLEHALSNYYKSIESKNPEFKHPRIKVISSSKLEKTAVEDAKKLVELKAAYDDAKKRGDKAEADKFKSEFKSLKAKKSKASADVIDLNDLEFIKNFDKEFIETKKDEAPSAHISDPELRGLIDILSQKQQVDKTDKTEKAQQKNEQQRAKIVKVLKSLGLEIHGSHLSTSSKRFVEKLENMEWFRLKAFNGLFKPVFSKNGITKRYLISVCNNFDSVLDQFVKGINKETIIKNASKNAFAVAHYQEEKPDMSSLNKEEREEAKKEIAALKSVETTIEFLALHEMADLKSHLLDYQDVMSKIGKVTGASYETSDAITLVKSIVKVSIELNAVKTFVRVDADGKTKESMIGDMFVKDLLGEVPVKITTGLRKKILTAIAEKKEVELTEEDVSVFETYEGGITNMNTFENLSSVSDSELKNLKAVRQAIGLRLFVEALRKIDKMIIAHGGKYGFNVVIYY